MAAAKNAQRRNTRWSPRFCGQCSSRRRTPTGQPAFIVQNGDQIAGQRAENHHQSVVGLQPTCRIFIKPHGHFDHKSGRTSKIPETYVAIARRILKQQLSGFGADHLIVRMLNAGIAHNPQYVVTRQHFAQTVQTIEWRIHWPQLQGQRTQSFWRCHMHKPVADSLPFNIVIVIGPDTG